MQKHTPAGTNVARETQTFRKRHFLGRNLQKDQKLSQKVFQTFKNTSGPGSVERGGRKLLEKSHFRKTFQNNMGEPDLKWELERLEELVEHEIYRGDCLQSATKITVTADLHTVGYWRVQFVVRSNKLPEAHPGKVLADIIRKPEWPRLEQTVWIRDVQVWTSIVVHLYGPKQRAWTETVHLTVECQQAKLVDIELKIKRQL